MSGTASHQGLAPVQGHVWSRQPSHLLIAVLLHNPVLLLHVDDPLAGIINVIISSISRNEAEAIYLFDFTHLNVFILLSG